MKCYRFARTYSAVLVVMFAGGNSWCSDAQILERLDARFRSDRSGVQVELAVIDGDAVRNYRYKAAAARGTRSEEGGSDSRLFEIGSISKTMLGVLVAKLVDEGKWTLDDPIEKHLPADALVPSYGRSILVRDLVTHSSGLPPYGLEGRPFVLENPYGDITPTQLLQELRSSKLAWEVGNRSEYSNFGAMVLSLAVSKAYDTDIESALRKVLLIPLGMKDTCINRCPPGNALVQGRNSAGKRVPAWSAAPELSGVGMVKATIGDLARYIKAGLTNMRSAPYRYLERSQREIAFGHGMFWFRRPIGARTFLFHEGATGGHSTVVLLEPEARRGVAIVADTNLSDMGGLLDVAFAVLVEGSPISSPRIEIEVPRQLWRSIQGEYSVVGRDTQVTIAERAGRLMLKTDDGGEIELKYDSHGDFFGMELAGVLTPRYELGGVQGFVWRQGGGEVEGIRRTRSAKTPSEDVSSGDYVGEYALSPHFTIRIFREPGKLWVQGTGQPATYAVITRKDLVELPVARAELEFHRDQLGVVVSATLRQRGLILQATRIPPRDR